MFGSKLRTWMENHIGRPRKKGNKNKNDKSNVPTTSSVAAAAGSGSLDVYKKTAATGFTIYHGNSTMSTTTTTSITAAPGSVSIPNGNHHHNNGCSSVISSPVRRREVSPIQNQSRYGWQSPDQETITSPKSDNFLYAPQHHHHRIRTNQTAPNSKENSCEEKTTKQQQLLQPDLSSSSFSSLSWSTGSKEPSMNVSNNNQQVQQRLHIESRNNSSTADTCTQSRNESCSELRDLEENEADVVHYEEICTILRHPEHITNNNSRNYADFERPKSEQLGTFLTKRNFYDYKTQDDASSRYGRLLPSKIQNQHTSGSIDSLNANHLRASNSNTDIKSNNNHISTTRRPVNQYQNLGNPNMMMPHPPRNSRLRTNRYVTQGLNGTQVQPQAAGPQMHILSSPESAYSTGYSTDGTSPGAIYTPPEYYINMRTGTHYFPKSVNSLAIEAQRYKFGLNKIEEMSPIDPLPKTSFANYSSHHSSTQSHIMANIYTTNNEIGINRGSTSSGRSPLGAHNTIVLPTLKGFESPSPRQRCRIRTNPWYSTTETSSSAATTVGSAQQQQQQQSHFMPPSTSQSTISSSKSVCSSLMKMEIDATSTSSSGIKSSNEARSSSDRNNKHNEKSAYDSSESSSSLTEVENMQRLNSPNTIRRKRTEHLQHTLETPVANLLYAQCATGLGSAREYPDAIISDEDATLNEMMGKFDESYVYEKETDILSSDSDPTDCASDLDTGQDAGDECDTDELLDIDFIDTSSIQEVNDRKDSQCNMGSCHYYNNNNPIGLTQQQYAEARASVRTRRRSRSLKSSHDANASNSGGNIPKPASQRRRKRFLKTRKKSTENREHYNSPVRKPRESRSVGGTPVCLRRNMSAGRERIYKTSPLSNRSSSLVFTDVRESRFMTIAESEKALLKADLEADVKYRQLILEAESLLVSIKSSVQSIPRETPVASPRRVNPLVNKRVEMLKNCEVENKRDQLKQQQQQQQQRSIDNAAFGEHELTAAINKRVEFLKYETTSAPNSPKFVRLSPRKTHLTNFINQNVAADMPLRKNVNQDIAKAQLSPKLHSSGRKAVNSPQGRRRYRSQSPKLHNNSQALFDSDSEADISFKHSQNISILNGSPKRNRNIQHQSSAEDMANHNYLPEIAKILLYEQSDYNNCNAVGENKSGMLTFNSVGGNMTHYCPQSEPLKRKVYKGSSTFERIKKSFDLESEIPKQVLLAKINHLRRERQQHTSSKLSSTKSSSQDVNHDGENGDKVSDVKKQLILNTIADLKRSLENQSVELNGLNED
ncbi:serine-rich adhesin for platelets [Teleopsis dalmanni]|uniref:serine-rich adhesin for platelets n=1 Tax=Teleopsis dalmanni TaxID=139649 RepID=UPI0018CE9026|nr:serine-rich adhesin for platelets [Teleopsis dalmanni]